MTRKSFSRTVKLSTASLMAVLFGFPGVAMANQASIRNTGPDSYNKIEFSDETKCEVENNNNVNAVNKVHQNAQTGDAVVGGSDWHRYDPTAWAAQGHSYEEWESAVSSYMAQNEHDWKNKWGSHGGSNTTGGDATSGDATNVSNNRTTVSIDNSGACDFDYPNGQTGHGSSKPGNKPGSVLGSKSDSKTGNSDRDGKSYGGSGHVLGSSTSGAYGSHGSAGSYGSGGGGSHYYPTTSGGTGGGSGGHGGGSGSSGGSTFSIGNTGPDSYNKISYDQSSYLSVKNTNNVKVMNFTTQNASSGDATVSGNTTGDSAGSGGAHNSSGNTTGAGINN